MGHKHSKYEGCIQGSGDLFSNSCNPPKRSLLKLRGLDGGERDLDTNLLLPLKIVFYALAISFVLLMVGHQVIKFRAKKRQARVLQGVDQEGFRDEDLEKAPSYAPNVHATALAPLAPLALR